MILLIDQSASVLREAAQLVEKWSVKEIIPASEFKVSNLSKNTLRCPTLFIGREGMGCVCAFVCINKSVLVFVKWPPTEAPFVFVLLVNLC